MNNVLVVTSDIVGKNMAGVGIRAYEIAKTLSRYFHVTLVTPGLSDIEAKHFEIVTYNLGEKGTLDCFLLTLNNLFISTLPFPRRLTSALCQNLPGESLLVHPVLLELFVQVARPKAGFLHPLPKSGGQ